MDLQEVGDKSQLSLQYIHLFLLIFNACTPQFIYVDLKGRDPRDLSPIDPISQSFSKQQMKKNSKHLICVYLGRKVCTYNLLVYSLPAYVRAVLG